MDRRVLLFVGFQDPKAGNAERESPRGTFLSFRSFGFVREEAAFSRLYPGSIGAIGEIRIAASLQLRGSLHVLTIRRYR